jgi:hypothetical protein
VISYCLHVICPAHSYERKQAENHSFDEPTKK